MNMKERKEPKFVKFDKDGEVIEGVLIGVDRPEIGGKKVARFILADVNIGEGDRVIPTGDRTCFLGTADLVQKINVQDMGHFFSIRYEGEDHGIKRNGNSMRRFKVMLSETPVFAVKNVQSEADSTFITDADIPF